MTSSQLTGRIQRGRVDRPHGVDHPPGRQVPPGSGYRLTGGQAGRVVVPPDRPALLQYRRTTSPVDRSIHAATTQERRVRRVNDGVDVLKGDVALDDLDSQLFRAMFVLEDWSGWRSIATEDLSEPRVIADRDEERAMELGLATVLDDRSRTAAEPRGN